MRISDWSSDVCSSDLHLMIWNINPAAVRVGKLPMIFVFSNNNNERILFDLKIRQASAAGDQGSEAMDHGGMDMGDLGAAGAAKGAADPAKESAGVARPSGVLRSGERRVGTEGWSKGRSR